MIYSPYYKKYGNTRIWLDNHLFHSKKEMNRYSELKLLERTGGIKNLILQPKFLLQEKFEYQGKKYREITYIADFAYIQYKPTKYEFMIVEDVKASEYFMTDVYKIKKRLFLYKYPDYIFREIF